LNRKDISLTIVTLALIAGTAGLLQFLQSGRTLGKPGVKVVPAAVFTDEGKLIGTNAIAMPALGWPWDTKFYPVTKIEHDFLPKDTTYGRQQYLRATDGFSAAISAVLMGTDRTSIHKPQFCLTGQGWTILKTETDTIPVQKPHPYSLNVMKLTTLIEVGPEGNKTRVSGVYVYWFVADGQLTPHHGERMWWMARDLLTKGTLQRWAYVTYFTTCHPGQEDEAYAKLKDFIAQTVPQIQLTAGVQVAESGSTPAATGALAVNPLPVP